MIKFRNSILLIAFITAASCGNDNSNLEGLADARLNSILLQSKEKVMSPSNLKEINKLFEISKDTAWTVLAQQSAIQMYEARGAEVLTEDCINYLRQNLYDSSQSNKFRSDSIYYVKIGNKISQLLATTNLSDKTFIEILIYNETLSQLSAEIKKLCNQ